MSKSRIKNKTIAVFLALIILTSTVFAFAFVPVSVGAQQSGQQSPPPEPSDGSVEEGDDWTDGPGNMTQWNRHGLEYLEYLTLWSNDVEKFNQTKVAQVENYTFQNGYTFEESREIASTYQLAQLSDLRYTTPEEPATTSTKWNQNDFNEYQLAQDKDTVFVPQNTSTSGNTVIREAFIKEYTITPSTTRHTDDMSRLISDNGTAHLLTDYWVRTPNWTAKSRHYQRWYTFESTDVVELRLRSGANQCAFDNTTCDIARVNGTDADYTTNLGYDNVSLTTQEFVYEARINASFTFHRLTCTDLDEHPDGKHDEDVETGFAGTQRPGRGYCDGPWEYETEPRTFSHIVSSTEQVEVNSLENVGAEFLRLPYNSSSEERLGYQAVFFSPPEDDWAYATNELGVGVTSGYTFYTERDTAWDVMNRSSQTNTSEPTYSYLQPVEVHAVPSPEGIQSVTNWGGARLETVSTTTTQVNTQSIGENVTLPLPATPYADGRFVVFNYIPAESPRFAGQNGFYYLQNLDRNGERAKYYGLVHGTETITPYQKPKTMVGTETNITVLNTNADGTVEVSVTVTDSNGGVVPVVPVPYFGVQSGNQLSGLPDPASTYRYGHVEMNDGQEVFPAENSIVTVDAPDGVVTAKYIAPQWYYIYSLSNNDPFYEQSEDTVRVSNELGVGITSIAMVVLTIGMFVLLVEFAMRATGRRYNYREHLRDLFKFW